MLIVCEICEWVCEMVGVIVLVGVVLNKFIVKIVFDWNKFDGLFVVWLYEIDVFVVVLLVCKLYGVGKVMVMWFDWFGI